jgi:hypothetical protein
MSSCDILRKVSRRRREKRVVQRGATARHCDNLLETSKSAICAVEASETITC